MSRHQVAHQSCSDGQALVEAFPQERVFTKVKSHDATKVSDMERYCSQDLMKM